MKMISNLFYSRWLNFTTLSALTVMLAVISSQAVDGGDMSGYDSVQAYVTSRHATSSKGIDACFCCANKQLSFCCSACMERGGGGGGHAGSSGGTRLKSTPAPRPAGVHVIPGESVGGLGGGDPTLGMRMSATERMLSLRIRMLRVSACNCCQRSAGRSRKCCMWCGSPSPGL